MSSTTLFRLSGIRMLLGAAVIPAKVFPSLVGIPLMVAGVLSHVTTFSSGVLIALMGLMGIVCAAIEYGRAGLILTTQHNVRGAKLPSSVLTVLSL